eukprot:scaffold3871_cov97-Isochrysis_galbana.AAC.9
MSTAVMASARSCLFASTSNAAPRRSSQEVSACRGGAGDVWREREGSSTTSRRCPSEGASRQRVWRLRRRGGRARMCRGEGQRGGGVERVVCRVCRRRSPAAGWLARLRVHVPSSGIGDTPPGHAPSIFVRPLPYSEPCSIPLRVSAPRAAPPPFERLTSSSSFSCGRRARSIESTTRITPDAPT